VVGVVGVTEAVRLPALLALGDGAVEAAGVGAKVVVGHRVKLGSSGESRVRTYRWAATTRGDSLKKIAEFLTFITERASPA
jgi:hypothetical protein